MSLYEQFYSDINKNFMFNMIKDIIQKDTKFDISIDSTNYDHFLSTFDKICERLFFAVPMEVI